jgi:hypothetical protein
MLKSVATLCLVGLGVLAAQGCSVEAGDEGVATVQDELGAGCLDAQGAKVTQAALAVAMGDELGRWEPLSDLQLVKEGYFLFTRLKPTAVCLKNNCAQTKAILGQQNFTVDQNKFSETNFRSTIEQSFGRQTNMIANLKKNNPGQLPPLHKLTKLNVPLNVPSACGVHYVFQVDKLDGTPLNATEVTNMKNALCFFGQDTPTTGCGGNPFVHFVPVAATEGCPAGKACVAIDPDPNDNGTVTTTTSGAGPIYPMNRLYDTANTYLNTSCTTTTGKAGKMLSKCSTQPATCGYLYCTP